MHKEKLEERTRRLSNKFVEELEDIKKQRCNRGKINKVSDQMITFLIPKHPNWKRIKEEIIEIPNLTDYVNQILLKEKHKKNER